MSKCKICDIRYPTCCLKPCNRLNNKYAMIGRDLCINPCLAKKLLTRGTPMNPIIVPQPGIVNTQPIIGKLVEGVIIPQSRIGVYYPKRYYVSHPNLAPQNHPPASVIAHRPTIRNSSYLTTAGATIKSNPVLSPLHQPPKPIYRTDLTN